MAKKSSEKKFRNNAKTGYYSLFNADAFSFSLSDTDLKNQLFPWTNETFLLIFSWTKWWINTIYACLCVASKTNYSTVLYRPIQVN